MIRFPCKFPAVLVVACSIAVAACHGGSPAPEQSSEAAATAPETKPGLSLSGGRIVLPAVSGNPAAAYFTLANGSAKSVRIAAVAIRGADMVMLHETRDMGGHSTMADMAAPEAGPGQSVIFAPGGKHVMIHDVPVQWKPGGTAEITLTFADGDKLSAPLAIQPAGSQ